MVDEEKREGSMPAPCGQRQGPSSEITSRPGHPELGFGIRRSSFALVHRPSAIRLRPSALRPQSWILCLGLNLHCSYRDEANLSLGRSAMPWLQPAN